MGWAMTADRTKTDPWWRRWWPGRPGTDRAHAGGGRDEDTFKQSMAELSRRAAERAAKRSTGDPADAARARQAAMQAYERTRARRQRLALGFALGAVLGSGVAALVPDSRPEAVARAAALAEPATPLERASLPAVSLPAAAAVEPPATTTTTTTTTTTAEVDRAPAPVEQAAPNDAPLQRDEIREVQDRLRSFGFNPGPADGVAGRTTMGAAMHYQMKRDQIQTGTVDRRLLEQLRQDPAPHVAPPAAPEAQRVAQRTRSDTRSTGARRQETAGDRIGRWLDSLVR